MVTLAKQAIPNGKVSHVMLFEALGAQFAEHPPPEATRLPILNDVWKVSF